MIGNRAYKIKLYPNKTQEKQLNAIIDGSRFVYNYFLNLRREYYLSAKKTLPYAEMSRQLTQLRKTEPVLQGIQLEPLSQSLRRLDSAYNRFFRKVSKFPRFKSRFAPTQSFQKHRDYRFIGNRLQVQKDLLVKFRGNLKTDNLGTLVIVKLSTGEWFAVVSTTILSEGSVDYTSPIGVDMGIETLVSLSTGEKYKNIRPQETLQSKLKVAQKELARREKGSKRREESKKKVARIYRKIRNTRENHIHNVTRQIVNANPSLIAVEDLNVRGMMQNHSLARVIADASMREVLRQLKYKQEFNGGQFVEIDRWFPSSKTCSNCFFIADSMPLSKRKWNCPQCGTKHDRDTNAARVILQQGLAYNSRGVSERVGVSQESPVTAKRKQTKV